MRRVHNDRRVVVLRLPAGEVCAMSVAAARELADQLVESAAIADRFPMAPGAVVAELTGANR